MYIKQDDGLGFWTLAPVQGVDIDYKKAVRLNRYYRKVLGWDKDYSHILRVLGYTTTRPPDEEAFAQQIAFWQRNQGMKGKEIDGIIGKNTWARIQAAIRAQSQSARPQTAKPKPTMSTDKQPSQKRESRIPCCYKKQELAYLRAVKAAWSLSMRSGFRDTGEGRTVKPDRHYAIAALLNAGYSYPRAYELYETGQHMIVNMEEAMGMPGKIDQEIKHVMTWKCIDSDPNRFCESSSIRFR